MTTITTETELNVLPANLANNLLFLRGQREAMLKDLKFECLESEEEHLEKIADMGESHNSSFDTVLARAKADDRYKLCIKLHLFRRVCLRIARLEREACHATYIPSEMLAA